MSKLANEPILALLQSYCEDLEAFIYDYNFYTADDGEIAGIFKIVVDNQLRKYRILTEEEYKSYDLSNPEHINVECFKGLCNKMVKCKKTNEVFIVLLNNIMLNNKYILAKRELNE